MKSWIKYLLALGLVVIAGLLFYNKVFLVKKSFETIKACQGNLPLFVKGIGTVGAKDIYQITTSVSAKVLALYSDEGDWVKKGALLAVMDPVDLPITLAQAKEGVSKASLEAKAAKAELNSLMAQKTLLQSTYDRNQKLHKQGYASRAEYDKALTELKSIEAQIRSTRLHIRSSEIEIKRAQKSVDALKVKLTHYKIYAPVDGYIITRSAMVGESMQASKPLFSLVDPKSLWVDVKVDERISSKISKGQKATIVLRSRPDQTFKAIVARIASKSDPVTLEREIDVAFSRIPKPFYISEQAMVRIQVDYLKQTLIIPAKLLIYNKKDIGVWIAKEGKAHFQTIKLAGQSENKAAVAKGITAETLLLVPTAKNRSLSEGMTIFYD